MYMPSVMADSDVLDVVDAEASAWLAQQQASGSGDQPQPTPVDQSARPPPAMHLLLGCSVARDARLRVEAPGIILNLARRGNTWQKVAAHLDEDLDAWRRAAASIRMRCGWVVIWLSGNEAYDRHTGANLLADVSGRELEDTIRGVATRVREVSKLVLLGPLPRFYVDRLWIWEATAAYLLDRKVCEAALPGEFVSLGKSLTKKLGGKHTLVDDCEGWFQPDRIHLSGAGYRKVSQVRKFPQWLRVDM